MENKNEIFGIRLKTLRNRKKISQEEIANSIGISRARYSHYENNHVEPDIDLIRKLADYHNVDTDYLLGRTDNPHFVDLEENEETKRIGIMNKIATEFPDIDLMFKDIENWTTNDFEELYDYIKFKQSQKEK